MNDEESKQTSEAADQQGAAGEEKAAPARKRPTKKVVSRVRDAKSDSADRKPKEAPVDEDHSEAKPKGKGTRDDGPKEIKTVVEEAPEKLGKDDRRKSGRGGRRSGAKAAAPSRSAEPVDPEELSKRAWKIFQSDVAEEGITLVDNTTGRQLALRSFELARLFLEEKSRQTRLNSPAAEGKRPARAPKKEARQEPAKKEADADSAPAEESKED